NAGLFFGKNLLPALGTRLIAGRGFRPEDFTDLSQALAALANDEAKEFPHVTIVTQAVAQRLWPGQSALGKMVYLGKDIPLQVVGVVERLTRPAGGLF